MCFSLLGRIQTDPGAHSASYPVGIAGYRGCKTAVAWSW